VYRIKKLKKRPRSKGLYNHRERERKRDKKGGVKLYYIVTIHEEEGKFTAQF
jgi:hypothetical protein